MTNSKSNVTREYLLAALDRIVNGAGQESDLPDLRAFIEAAPEKGGADPVAWLLDHGGEQDVRLSLFEAEKMQAKYGGTIAPLYAHPAAAKEPGVTEAMIRALRAGIDNKAAANISNNELFVGLTAALAQQQGTRKEDVTSSDPTIRQVYPQYGMGGNQVRITNTKVNPDGSLSVEIYFQAKREG